MQHRPRQAEAPGHAGFGELRQLRPARIAQAEQLGGLVEGLAGGVVHGFAEQRVVAHPAHPHQLGVAARGQQRDEGEGGRIGRQQWRQQVALEVMQRQRRDPARHREGLRHARPHQQRAGEPGPAGVGHGVDVRGGQPGLGQGLAQQQRQAADVVARGELGHYPAIGRVQVDLRVQAVRAQAGLGVVDRHAGLVAGGFDAEHFHRVASV